MILNKNKNYLINEKACDMCFYCFKKFLLFVILWKYVSLEWK